MGKSYTQQEVWYQKGEIKTMQKLWDHCAELPLPLLQVTVPSSHIHVAILAAPSDLLTHVNCYLSSSTSYTVVWTGWPGKWPGGDFVFLSLRNHQKRSATARTGQLCCIKSPRALKIPLECNQTIDIEIKERVYKMTPHTSILVWWFIIVGWAWASSTLIY